MPSQSRGFWSCDFCRATFDVFDEAKFHETEQCQHRPGLEQQRTPSHSSSFQREHYAAKMPPMSEAPQKPAGLDYEVDPRNKAAVIPLMTPHEVSELAESDAAACQNLEAFEASADHVATIDPGNIQVGQVGLRCMHCANNPLTVAKNGIAFPSCVDGVAESVHKLSAMHLSHCGMAPTQLREISQEAEGNRRRAEMERGALWHDLSRCRSVLQSFCIQFCQRYGIIDKSSSKTGIIFSMSDSAAARADSSARHMGIASAERHGPGRSIPGPSMMGPGPTGNDPLAPTPLARRRDRPREEHPYSADRTAPTAPAGYDTPYAHGHGPPQEGYYEVMPDAAATHTPAQLAQRMEEPPDSAHPTPMSAPPPEASPSAGYQPPTPYDMPNSFPFYQEHNGNWCCRYCSHVHPQYRDPQSVWSAPGQGPPPGHFIDQHLSRCRYYHQSMPPQPMYQGPPPPYPYMTPQYHMPYGPPQPGWDSSAPGHPTPGHPSQPMHYPHPHGAHGGEIPPPPPHAYPHTPHQMPPKYMDSARGAMVAPSRTPLPASGASRPDAGESAVRHAIEYLSSSDKKGLHTPGERTTADDQLVLDEDRLLLTDYFFYLMKQLRLCRFSEADRKTRGGKREKIMIGFGGLQCIHCAEASNSRKFFWSNVDRLANSFAEIPGHVLKCRHCPQQAKDALFQLKQHHPEQMARLPRGSQKVFFRRMWRRLHDEDPEPSAPDENENPEKKPAAEPVEETKVIEVSENPIKVESKPSPDISPTGTSGSDESALLLQRPTKEAAKALADSATLSLPPSPSSRVLLAIPEDKEWLSDTDCFIRRQIEVFCATKDDVATARSDRKYPVHEGQVGIRCIHCALSKSGPGASGSAVAFPFSISGIYESVREFQRLHLDTCENLPKDIKSRLSGLKGSTSLSSVLRKYYVLAAKALGLKDTRDGIRSGGESVPLGSQAAFAFSEGNPLAGMSEVHRTSASYSDVSPTVTPLESRKRKSLDPEQSQSAESKKKNLPEFNPSQG